VVFGGVGIVALGAAGVISVSQTRATETFLSHCAAPTQDGAYATPADSCGVAGFRIEAGAVCNWHAMDNYTCDHVGHLTCDPAGSGQWLGGRTPVCYPNNCTGGVIEGTEDPHADYHQCTDHGYTGQRCNPRCRRGWHMSAVSWFQLSCNGDGKYHGSGNLCSPDHCYAGPLSDTDDRADYDSCNKKLSGETCVPTCMVGYHVVGNFTLHCGSHGSGGYNASGAVCEANLCMGGPFPDMYSDPHANYSSCNSQRTGGNCNPTCAVGYDVSSLEGFPLKCIEGRGGVKTGLGEAAFYEAEGVTCIPKRCDGGPVPETRDPRAQYSECKSKHTGDICKPTCEPGYVLEGEIDLVCTHGDWDMYNASSARCIPAPCSGGPIGAGSKTNFTVCNQHRTGDLCTPECETGYKPIGKFQLVCINGKYDASSSSCTPNSCFAGPNPSFLEPSNATSNDTIAKRAELLWGDCNSEHTGTTCLPSCPMGKGLHGGLFPLLCDADGHYDVPSDTECELKCSGGPINPAEHAVYDGCNQLLNGALCRPRCHDGYTSNGNFKLHCLADHTYNASGAECVPNSCSGGPTRNLNNITDFSDCYSKVTGDICVPECPAGYRAGNKLSLICDSNSQFTPLFGAMCSAEKCTGGPVDTVKPPEGSVVELQADFRDCDKLVTNQTCTAACPYGYHANGSFTLLCQNNLYPTHNVVCAINECKSGVYPGYVFKSPKCTNVATCGGAEGLSCLPGYVNATPTEGGLQLECPVHGGYFAPDGCSAVACPRGATMCDGVCQCDEANGWKGDLIWTNNRWQGPSQGGCMRVSSLFLTSLTFWLIVTIIVLTLIICILIAGYQKRGAMYLKEKELASRNVSPRSRSRSPRVGAGSRGRSPGGDVERPLNTTRVQTYSTAPSSSYTSATLRKTEGPRDPVRKQTFSEPTTQPGDEGHVRTTRPRYEPSDVDPFSTE